MATSFLHQPSGIDYLAATEAGNCGVDKGLFSIFTMIRLELDRLIRRALELLSIGLQRYSSRIDDFLLKQSLEKAGTGNAESIPAWTKKSELRMLYNLASACPHGAAALEIGSYVGASSCYLAAGLTNVGGHLFCVDTWSNETMPDGLRDTFAEFEQNTRGVRPYITPVRKRSDELTLADIRVPLDLIFIDGDHSYAAVKSDFERAQRWLAQDGIIVFHDCGKHYEGVTLVVGEALASGHWMIVGFHLTLVWIKRATWSPRLSSGSPDSLG